MQQISAPNMIIRWVYSQHFALPKRHFIHRTKQELLSYQISRLTPDDHYSGRTAPLTSKRSILYIYSNNIVLNILNMVYTVRFFSSKCSLFRNYNILGS